MNTSLNLRRNEKKPGRRTDDDELLEILSIIIIIAPLVDICVVKLLLKTLLASHLTHFSFCAFNQNVTTIICDEEEEREEEGLPS